MPHLSTLYVKFLKFGLIGILGTAAHYSLMITLVELLGIGIVASTSAGFILGAMTNYALNYKYTFYSDKKHTDSGTKFLLIAVFTGVINSTSMSLLINFTSIDYMFLQLFVTGVIFVFNFLLNNYWTFR